MKQLLQNLRDGKTEVVEVPIPTPKPGTALVRTAASLVSAGTERMLVEFAGKSLVGKAQARPDLVRQVLDKAQREGVLPTVQAAFNRLDQPLPLGYSSAGVIVALGVGLEGFQVGQRVACAGGGYAVHAEYALVPQNLLAPLPDTVDFDAGAFGTLGAIAMQGFRLGQPQIGERVVVIGLGLLGLLAAKIAQAAGCQVLGIDLVSDRIELAEKIGIPAVLRPQAEAHAMAFSQNRGADLILICADTSSNDPVELAGDIARDRGRVVSIGVVGMELPRRTYFSKELDFIVSRSYGPGRYDHAYEEGGHDYPAGYVRWTAGRNLESFVELIATGQLEIAPLITHRFPIDVAADAYQLITGELGEPFLGVLLTYPYQSPVDLKAGKTVTINPTRDKAAAVNLGVLGAGVYAGAMLLPLLKDLSPVNLVGIASASGQSAQHAARRFGFGYATSDVQALLDDPKINTLAVLTRHNLHTPQTLAALQAGKHVFCEKPLAITLEQLAEVETELEKPDCPLLLVGFNRRFAPLAVQMHEFIAKSQEPLMMHYRVNAGYLPPEHWHHDLAEGGGRIVSEGCHFIDFLTWLVGQPPVAVSTQALPDQGRYHQDNVTITLTFPNGSVGTIAYLANGDKSFSKERVEVFSGGRIAVLDDYRTLKTVYDGRRKTTKSRFKQDKGHGPIWLAFAEAIKTGGAPPIPYNETLAVMRATFAAVQALEQGQQVPCN